jgi:hypothetical protein
MRKWRNIPTISGKKVTEMQLQKRDCPLEIELIPRGAGWTYVCLTTGGERIDFVISNVMGGQFSDLVRILYFFSPGQYDSDSPNWFIECADGDFTLDEVPPKVAAEFRAHNKTTVHYVDIPHRAEFQWDEEPGFSHWILERVPNLHEDFNVKLHIKIQRCGQHDGVYDLEFEKEYDFEFRYKDLCYAVAKAYTKVLKEFGFGVITFPHSTNQFAYIICCISRLSHWTALRFGTGRLIRPITEKSLNFRTSWSCSYSICSGFLWKTEFGLDGGSARRKGEEADTPI